MNSTPAKRMTFGRMLLLAIYFLLATGMYYFNEESLQLGIDLLYKVVFALVITFISAVFFLVKTDLPRARKLWRYLCILLLPHLVILVLSMPIWVFNVSPAEVVRRGAFAQVYSIALILAGAGMRYVFGEKGLWLNLSAMLAANLITIVAAIHANGFGAYWEELKTLVTSFGGEIGPIIAKAEINELTFALGLCLLFLVLNFREARRHRFFWIFLALTCFCYFSGFKRIGLAALLVTMLAKLLLLLITREKNSRRGWIVAFAGLVAVVSFVYICLVRGGLFDFLEREFGINTMGRRDLMEIVHDYYTIGPDYFGQGAGFVSRLFSDLPGTGITRALHNDVLALYIDMGFWGFWIWMIVFLPMRVWYVAKWQGVRGGTLCACYGLFIIATAITDNTIYYVYVTGAAAILTMGYRLDGAPPERRRASVSGVVKLE